MSDLIVLVFDSEGGAMQLRDKLLSLQKQQIIELADAAVVVRGQDGKAKVKQLHSLVGAGALGGAFWGMLIGLLFFMPWLGLAAGALGGALGGKFTDVGVDDKFNEFYQKLADELKGTKAKVLQTSLSNEQEAKLRDLFAADEVEG